MHLAEQVFQYYLLPTGNPPPHLVAQHNKIYHFWKTTWLNVLAGLQSDPSCLADDFMRQDFLAAVCTPEEVVSVHLYSIFALDTTAALEHRYLAGNYPALFFARMAELGLRTVMSLEYLTVNPNWRKGKCPVHMGKVTVALGAEVMKHYVVDAAIAPARRDHKVHELAYSLGGECVVPHVLNHNVDCDLIAIRREKAHCADGPVAELTARLWRDRFHVTNEGARATGARRVA